MNNLDKLESKIDRLDERLDRIDQTLIKQEANLQLHMMRSDNLEKIVAIQDKKLEPIEKNMNGLNFLVKFIGVMSLTSGMVLAIGRIFGLIKF